MTIAAYLLSFAAETGAADAMPMAAARVKTMNVLMEMADLSTLPGNA
jgi:hypothetical protein